MSKIKDTFNKQKDRVYTGVGLVALVVLVGLFNNFVVIWAFLGIVFMVAFYEAMRLFKIDDNKLYVYAVLIWVVSFFIKSLKT